MKYVEMKAKLQGGETIKVRGHGNSMTPLIRSGQLLTVEPIGADPIEVDDIVLAHVNGYYYFHKVTAIQGGRYRISNNHGHVNGWTKAVYGRVVKVED